MVKIKFSNGREIDTDNFAAGEFELIHRYSTPATESDDSLAKQLADIFGHIISATNKHLIEKDYGKQIHSVFMFVQWAGDEEYSFMSIKELEKMLKDKGETPIVSFKGSPDDINDDFVGK